MRYYWSKNNPWGKGLKRDETEVLFVCFVVVFFTGFIYWAGQKVQLGFSIRCYGKPWINFLANTMLSCIRLNEPFNFSQFLQLQNRDNNTNVYMKMNWSSTNTYERTHPEKLLGQLKWTMGPQSKDQNLEPYSQGCSQQSGLQSPPGPTKKGKKHSDYNQS